MERAAPLSSAFAASGNRAACEAPGTAKPKKHAILTDFLFPGDAHPSRKKLTNTLLDFALLLHVKKFLNKNDFAALCQVAIDRRDLDPDADLAKPDLIPKKVMTALEATFAALD